MSQAIAAKFTITGAILLTKAQKFAESFEYDDFKCSIGWLNNFKQRHNISQYMRHGEADSAPLDTLPREREKLQQIISNYDANDIFNCDETGLFWKLEPSKTLAQGSQTGIKKSKERVTILLICNATGTQKLKPLFIHKYKNPRALMGINLNTLSVDYYWNKTSWMQTSIWNSYLKQLDSKMRYEKRKILLLVDNAPVHSHEILESLTNIHVEFLPPNITAHLQPLDQGIINSFKTQYHKLLL